MGYPLVAVHVPKTIDNDLPITDNCPGFGSVAKYVATSMREAGYDVASMARTSTKVFVLEVMGRHAGWITAAVGLAQSRGRRGAARAPLSRDRLRRGGLPRAGRRDREALRLLRHRRLRGPAGHGRQVPVARPGSKDAFGHSQLGGVAPLIAGLVQAKLGYKYHWAVADYLQRSARHIASKTDLEQSYAVGKAAVELAVAGQVAA